MSSQKLPVPSKAALTALRGLVFGTSCSLILITEDRRRRINTARHALDNRERLQSAKQYHEGGYAALLPPENDDPSPALWQNGGKGPAATRRRSSRPDYRHGSAASGQTPGRSRNRDLASPSTTGEASRSTQTQTPLTTGQMRPAQPRSDPVTGRPIIPFEKSPSPFSRTDSGLWSASHLTLPSQSASDSQRLRVKEDWGHIRDQVTVLCRTGAEDGFQEAASILLSKMKTARASQQTTSLLEICAGFIRTAQAHRFRNEAEAVFEAMLDHSSLEERIYYECEPLALIRSMLSRASRLGENNPKRRDQLRKAAKFYLPRLTREPESKPRESVKVGQKLLKLAFASDMSWGFCQSIYWRVMATSERSLKLASFVEVYIRHLYWRGLHWLVVKYFLLHYSNLVAECVEARSVPSVYSSLHVTKTCQLVSKSTEAAGALDAAKVLGRLATMGQIQSLGVGPVLRLLTGFWDRYRDFDETRKVFDQIVTSLGKVTASWRRSLARCIVQIAMESGDSAAVRDYLNLATLHDGDFQGDIRILGLFALVHAKRGNWDEVEKLWSWMKVRDGVPSTDSGNEFVPIIKEFAKQHDLPQTRQFLLKFLETYQVPITPYLVSFMGSQYASIRDTRAFIGWLRYCLSNGFELSPPLINTILSACHQRWRLPFRDLRAIYNFLRTYSPRLIDSRTARIMTYAAMAGPVSSKALTGAKIGSLHLHPSLLPPRGEIEKSADLGWKMRMHLSNGNPQKALAAYKRAIHQKAKIDDRTVQLAVTAALRLPINEDDCFLRARQLLQQAEQIGVDTDLAVQLLLVAQVLQIDVTSRHPMAQTQIFRVLQDRIRDWEVQGLRVSAINLNRAAKFCLHVKNWVGAAVLGLAAQSRVGAPEPCYDAYNFAVLIQAYAGMADAEGVRSSVRRAVRSKYCPEKLVLRQLKHARQLLEKRQRTAKTQLALNAVTQGIRIVKEDRRRVREGGRRVQGEAIEIIRAAQAKTLEEQAMPSSEDLPSLPSTPTLTSSDIGSGPSMPRKGLMNVEDYLLRQIQEPEDGRSYAKMEEADWSEDEELSEVAAIASSGQRAIARQGGM